jgi:hypothetical protein
MWESPEPDAAETGWAQRFFSAMEPYSTGGIYGTGAGDESRNLRGVRLLFAALGCRRLTSLVSERLRSRPECSMSGPAGRILRAPRQSRCAGRDEASPKGIKIP